MGARKWYLANATLPGTDEQVQVELWDGMGAFERRRAVAVGTYPLTGAELSYETAHAGVSA
ncbi:MAG: hypothetical protein HS111_01030 [Kofleriaceae bacterium]|nr:hypothetical protein [Kofleriaceae bacterium]